MRVVHVAKQFAPSIGGLEDAVLNLVRQQRERQDVDATVVTLDRLFAAPDRTLPERDQVGSIPVLRVPWSGSRRYPLAPSVLRHLPAADLVHVHGIDFFFDYLALTRPVHRRPLVATTHGGFFHTSYAARGKRIYFQTVTRDSAACYRRIIGSSEADTEVFSRICPPARLTCIENGVDVAKFAGAAAPEPNRRLIYFGRFASHKGILYLLAVLAALRGATPDAGPEWELVVAGGPGDLPAARIAEEAERLGVAGAVRIVDSPDEAALRALIAECSYFACASEHEGFGLAAVEAMSAGLIPVLSPLPTFRTFLAKAGAGVLIGAHDAAADAGTIAAADRVLRAGGTDWRRRVTDAAQLYGWTAAADQYLEVYRSVLR